jgi:hypothetical protein
VAKTLSMNEGLLRVWEEPAPGAIEESAFSLQWLRNMPCWAVSAFLHLILLSLLISVVTQHEMRKPVDAGTTEIAIAAPPPGQAPKPIPYNQGAKRGTQRQQGVPGARNVDKTVVPSVLKTREFESDLAVKVPFGNSLKDLTNFQTAPPDPGRPSPGIYDRIGLGPGASGRFGDRSGTGRVRSSILEDTESGPVEDVVYAALQWLVRHQSPEGCWKSAGFTGQCTKTCQNFDPTRYGDGRGFADHDVGVTGLSMLAMAGYGQTHQSGEFDELVQCLRKAVAWMRKVQVRSDDPTTNGRYGGAGSEQWIYDHAIATMAMAELLIMSGDVIGLKNSVTDAVKLCLRAQNDGRGWRYGIKPGDNDTSVTGWMVLALKTAKAANLDIPASDFDRAFAGASSWLSAVTDAKGQTGYMAPGDPGSMLVSLQKKGDLYPYSKELSCMTAVGVLCRIFSGESRTSRTIRDGVRILMAQPPHWQEEKGRALSTINIYYWYYGSYALFQFGGPEWKRWNKDMQKALLETQRQGEICEDGSWDPIDEWGAAGGRVYSTALGAMTFEVYYRYRRL